jgi:Uma2 family endonuclease
MQPLENAPRRCFTAADLETMVDAGILDEDERVELLDGDLILVSPQGPRHAALLAELRGLLAEAFGLSWHVRVQSPLAAGSHSLPEPDLAVVRGAPRSYLDRHPEGGDACLVVELAASSQDLDRAKARIYAAAGVAEYWLLDLVARRLEVRSEPGLDGSYRLFRVLRAEERVTVPGCGRELLVAALLP